MNKVTSWTASSPTLRPPPSRSTRGQTSWDRQVLRQAAADQLRQASTQPSCSRSDETGKYLTFHSSYPLLDHSKDIRCRFPRWLWYWYLGWTPGNGTIYTWPLGRWQRGERRERHWRYRPSPNGHLWWWWGHHSTALLKSKCQHQSGGHWGESVANWNYSVHW